MTEIQGFRDRLFSGREDWTRTYPQFTSPEATAVVAQRLLGNISRESNSSGMTTEELNALGKELAERADRIFDSGQFASAQSKLQELNEEDLTDYYG